MSHIEGRGSFLFKTVFFSERSNVHVDDTYVAYVSCFDREAWSSSLAGSSLRRPSFLERWVFGAVEQFTPATPRVASHCPGVLPPNVRRPQPGAMLR